MSDAPERIWLDAWGSYYVRADLHRSLALDALAAETQAADAYSAQLKAEAMAAKLADALREIAKEQFYPMGIGVDAQFTRSAKAAQKALAEYEASK